jgi:hypothetical protein
MARASAAVTATGRTRPSSASISRAAARCRRKFLHYFPNGFRDETYFDWERGYKQNAHMRWQESLHPREARALIRAKQHGELARRAISIEGRTNLLFSFEKIALRHAVRTPSGSKRFADGLLQLVQGRGSLRARFESWLSALAALPHEQTRVLSWPVATVFGFLACPDEQIFVKPTVTRRAADAYGFDFDYASRPNWDTYANVLAFADLLRRDLADLRPKDMIDVQSFIWVLGSDEYPW